MAEQSDIIVFTYVIVNYSITVTLETQDAYVDPVMGATIGVDSWETDNSADVRITSPGHPTIAQVIGPGTVVALGLVGGLAYQAAFSHVISPALNVTISSL